MLNEPETTTKDYWVRRKKRMPAVSKAQRRAMGMAKAIQEGKLQPESGTASAQIASSMKPGDLDEFASTKEKGLPKRKTRRMGAKKDHRKLKGVRKCGGGMMQGE